LPTCAQAVTLYPDNQYLLRSRGLARALTGNRAGAIAGFQGYVAIPDLDAEWKTRVEGWICDLQAGKTPFTRNVLDSLKNQSIHGASYNAFIPT
jgi:hypothetical protein